MHSNACTRYNYSLLNEMSSLIIYWFFYTPLFYLFYFIFFYLFGCPVTFGVPGPGIRSELLLQAVLQLNPVYWAGACATAGISSSLVLFLSTQTLLSLSFPRQPFFLFVFFPFLGPLLQHMEVPRPGVELELLLQAYAKATAMRDPSHVCNLHHSSGQCQILNALNENRDQTHTLMVPTRIG